MDTQVNIDYAKIIGEKEIQIEALRIVLQQKNNEIVELKKQITNLTATPEDEVSDA